MQRSLILFLFAFICGVLGDVSISKPTAGETFSGSTGTVTIDVAWVDADSDGDYVLSNVKFYSFVLCAGTDNDIEAVYTIATNQKLSSTKYTATFDNTVAVNGYYFIQVYAMFKDGDATMHYTGRFQLTGMKGTTATFTFTLDATETGSGPDPQTNYNGATTSIDSASFSVTYTKQTGKTRYAPMQTQPATTVTHSTWSIRYASSAYTPYTSASPSPNVDSTITPGWSYSVTSVFNDATIQDSPTSWYNPGARVTQATLSTASKKRRWID